MLDFCNFVFSTAMMKSFRKQELRSLPTAAMAGAGSSGSTCTVRVLIQKPFRSGRGPCVFVGFEVVRRFPWVPGRFSCPPPGPIVGFVFLYVSFLFDRNLSLPLPGPRPQGTNEDNVGSLVRAARAHFVFGPLRKVIRVTATTTQLCF